MAAAKQKVTLTFDKEKVTPNTVRYLERESDEAPAVRTIYVQKHVVKQLGDPESLTVTIEAGE